MRRRAALILLPAVLATAALLCVPSGLALPEDDVISITSGPSGETTSRDATFAFEPGTRSYDYATCQLDSSAETTCGSPVSYTDLALGAHRFLVRGYSSRGGLLGSDSRSWTIVEGSPPPPPPPPAPPPPPTAPPTGPPPPGPSPKADLVVSSVVVAPGAPVELDASGSIGPVILFAFDVDGNGSYETKCSSGKAAAVYSQTGSYTIGVQVLVPGGQKSTATRTITVAGEPKKPPSGATDAAPPKGTTIADCLGAGAPTSADAFLCPRTVVVGVAEATPLPTDPDACFQFTKPGAPLKGAHVQYVLKGVGAALVNGLHVVGGGGKIGVDATDKRVFTTGNAWVRLYSSSQTMISVESVAGPFSWNVGTSGVVGSLKVDPPSSFFWLSSPGSARPLIFTKAKEAQVPLSVQLPSPFQELVSWPFTVRSSSTDGVIVEAFVANIGKIGLGPFTLGGIKIAYQKEGSADVWASGISLGFDGVQGGGELRIKNGSINYLKLFLQKDNPGIPLGCCAYLTYLSGEYVSSALKADAVISIGPSISTPWGTHRFASLDPLSLKLSLGSFFLVTAQGDIKVVGKKVGLAQVTLTDSSFFFYGALNTSFLDVLEVGVVVSGSIKSSGAWYAGGEGSICVADIKCAKGALAISSKGVAGCISVSALAVGGYVRWSGSWGIFWECGWGKVQSESGAPTLRSNADATTLDVRVPAGATARLFRIGGRGGAPHVLLVGPDGRRIEATARFSESPTHLVVQAPQEQATYVAVRRPAAGTWRVTALPGSVALTSIGSAGPLPARMVKASVRKAGASHVLRYELERVPGFTVSFRERGNGIDRLIGPARGRAGTLRFVPAEAPARTRRVEAVVEADGIGVRREVVARFTAPPLRQLPRPTLALRRQGSSLVVRWLPVAGARGYLVVVTPEDAGTQSFDVPARRTSLRVRRVGLRAGAVVTVRALSREWRPGRVARARLRPEPSVRVVSANRNAVSFRCLAAADGVCRATLRFKGRQIASGAVRLGYGKSGLVRARLTPSGKRLVRAVRVPSATLVVEVPGERARSLRVKLR